jgi:PAS domain S-box-containing protein
MKAINESLVVIDSKGKIKLVNEATCLMFGFESEELVGSTLDVLLDDNVRWEDKMLVEEIIRDGSIPQTEIRMYSKNKVTIPASISGSVVLQGGRFGGIIYLIYDLSNRKALEKGLVQARKLEAIGQLAAGIAHEINTPLQYIGDNTEFVNISTQDLIKVISDTDGFIKKLNNKEMSLEEFTENVQKVKEEADIEYLFDEIPKAMEQSKEGVSHVVNIVKSLKTFSHPGSKDRQLVDVNKMLDNVITVSRSEWKYVADISTQFDDNLELVPCLARELNQVFLNLIVNAAHAIEEHNEKQGSSESKGEILISTHSNKEVVEIRIKDSGGGIPKDVQPRIFDPFFTTKDVGKGTGQGLALAHKVITEQHEGKLDFETEPGQTTFIITLPLVHEQAVATEGV